MFREFMNKKILDISLPGTDFKIRFDFDEMKKRHLVKTKEDFKAIIAFVKYSLRKHPTEDPQIHWLGVPSWQFPSNNWAIQELITELKPDFIIETGTLKGGTALFYATILEKVNKAAKVITIDTAPQVEEAAKFDVFNEVVIVVKGDCVSQEAIKGASESLAKNSKVLVILDSLHTKEHVLKELELYSNFTSLNSYIIVQDTILYLGNPDNGPMGAIKEFLKSNKNYEIDYSENCANFQHTFLKKIK